MKLQGKNLAILAEDLYQDLELWYPLLRMREEGARVTVLGTEAGTTYKSKVGYPVFSDKAVREARAADYDGVIIPGGYAPDLMRRHKATLPWSGTPFPRGRWWLLSATPDGCSPPPAFSRDGGSRASRPSEMTW